MHLFGHAAKTAFWPERNLLTTREMAGKCFFFVPHQNRPRVRARGGICKREIPYTRANRVEMTNEELRKWHGHTSTFFFSFFFSFFLIFSEEEVRILRPISIRSIPTLPSDLPFLAFSFSGVLGLFWNYYQQVENIFMQYMWKNQVQHIYFIY